MTKENGDWLQSDFNELRKVTMEKKEKKRGNYLV